MSYSFTAPFNVQQNFKERDNDVVIISCLLVRLASRLLKIITDNRGDS